MKQERWLYPDFLRAISCCFVVLIHITSFGVNNFSLGSSQYTLSILVNSISRWAVPIFFMVSGMFLLNPNYVLTKNKLIKKVAKLLIIAVVWGGVCFIP